MLAAPSRGSKELSVWCVELAPHAPGVSHQVTREEVFVVLEGEARVIVDESPRIAKQGDAIVIPRDTTFRIESAGATAMRALCCLPVGGQARTDDGKVFTPPWAE
jgi:quercetin dioxygenase-like cupin family protein